MVKVNLDRLPALLVPLVSSYFLALIFMDQFECGRHIAVPMALVAAVQMQRRLEFNSLVAICALLGLYALQIGRPHTHALCFAITHTCSRVSLLCVVCLSCLFALVECTLIVAHCRDALSAVIRAQRRSLKLRLRSCRLQSQSTNLEATERGNVCTHIDLLSVIETFHMWVHGSFESS